MPTLLGLTSSSRTRASSRVAFADERSPARCPALNLRPAFTRGLSNHGTRFAICFAICWAASAAAPPRDGARRTQAPWH